MLRILFHTAGGKSRKNELGLGHIFRCINLANELKPNTIFFQIQDFGHVKNILQKNGFQNISLNSKNNIIANDVKETLKIIEKNKIDILIIDKFKMKKNFSKIMKNYIKTVVISDLDKIDFDAHLIINGFIGYPNQIVKNRYGVKSLIGPKYQILNKNFSNKTNFKKKYTLLVTFGGIDDRDILSIFCNVIEKYLDKIIVKIIQGPETKTHQRLKKLQRTNMKKLFVINYTNNMKNEMARTKYGLCSGGITSYEFAFMKIPFAIICQYPHQLKTALEWEKKGLAKNLGFSLNKLEQKITEYIENIIKDDVFIPKKSNFSQYGTNLIAQEIIKLGKNSKI